MKMKLLQEAALHINQDLLDAERNCDGMIASLAKIALTISTTREASGLAIHHGQEALARLADSFSAVTVARQEVIRLHDGLADQNRRLGEPLKLNGDGGKPPAHQITPELRAA